MEHKLNQTDMLCHLKSVCGDKAKFSAVLLIVLVSYGFFSTLIDIIIDDGFWRKADRDQMRRRAVERRPDSVVVTESKFMTS